MCSICKAISYNEDAIPAKMEQRKSCITKTLMKYNKHTACLDVTYSMKYISYVEKIVPLF
jgi:hypothetical protein